VSDRIGALARDLLSRAEGRSRYIFAVVGAPGAGKSTLAEALVAALAALAPGRAALMPMDGFHYDNAVLDARGLRPRKGAPETFDVDGLVEALARIRRADRPVALPVFDRDLDLARAGARIVGPETPLIVLEGNYLLLDAAPWDRLAPMLDRTLYLDVPEAELHRRLVARWLHHGLDPAAARARAEGNDIPNARTVATRSRPADLTWGERESG
jgi:pantothenate kinase